MRCTASGRIPGPIYGMFPPNNLYLLCLFFLYALLPLAPVSLALFRFWNPLCFPCFLLFRNNYASRTNNFCVLLNSNTYRKINTSFFLPLSISIKFRWLSIAGCVLKFNKFCPLFVHSQVHKYRSLVTTRITKNSLLNRVQDLNNQLITFLALYVHVTELQRICEYIRTIEKWTKWSRGLKLRTAQRLSSVPLLRQERNRV